MLEKKVKENQPKKRVKDEEKKKEADKDQKKGAEPRRKRKDGSAISGFRTGRLSVVRCRYSSVTLTHAFTHVVLLLPFLTCHFPPLFTCLSSRSSHAPIAIRRMDRFAWHDRGLRVELGFCFTKPWIKSEDFCVRLFWDKVGI